MSADGYPAAADAQPTRQSLPESKTDATADGFPVASLDALDASSASSSASAAKIAVAIPVLADYLVNGFWQYNSELAHHWGSTTITYNISALTTAERFLAQSALNAWHEVANINFVLTTGAANITYTHNGTMTAYESDSFNGSGIISSAVINISADWITNDGGAYDGKTGIDSYGYQTYIHETGHALGLGHQGPYNGSASYATGALFANDTWQYSVMSYFSENNFSGSSYRYVVTPQMADIDAAQAIYGAATTRVGDTVYGFHSNAGAIFDFTAYTSAPALTIYDSGGTDTLDCSGYSAAQYLDLHAGSFSSVGGLIHNIGIAMTATIEVAIGGSGSDTLIASDAGCTLKGGGGVDTLYGGAGADTFVFVAGDSSAASGQHDRIINFAGGSDRIDLSGFDAVSSTTGIIDSFDFIATATFNGVAGALDYFYDSLRGVTVLQGDTNGDRVADFAIDLTGNISLSSYDLLGIMLTTRLVEASGSTRLSEINNHFFLYNGAGVGPSLKYGGADAIDGQFGAWTPIGAEQITGGYLVVFKYGSADQYTVWTTDSNGSFLSYNGTVSGSDFALTSLESGFVQDLNGDGTVGLVTTVIESYGATRLTGIGNHFFLYDSGATGPSLKYGGTDVFAGEFGAWTPIGAEQISGGYLVALKFGSADQYTVWTTDSSGNFVSYSAATSGADYSLTSQETSFHQDLNGDGNIGLVTTVIESNGATRLTEVGNHFFLYDSGGVGPSLKYGGADVYAGEFGAWAPIGAEQITGGYLVALKFGSADQYTVWTTDSSGRFVSYNGTATGSDFGLMSLENTFHQDLNGDGQIGLVTTVIEANGATRLTEVGNHFFLYDSGGTGPSLKYGGADVYAGEFGAWTPIGAEQITGGYLVAFKFGGADQYTVWTTDSSGSFVSYNGSSSGSDARLTSLESVFSQDLNGDGHVSVAGALITGAGQAAATAGHVYYANESDGLMTGAAGSDTFVFKPDFGKDTVANFHPGEDILAFDRAIFADVAAVVSHMADDGHGNTTISAGVDDIITIHDVTMASLQQHLSDFHIV